MAYDSRRVGDEVIRLAQKANEQISIMSVLKLVYISHGWTLALLNRPLIRDRIEAWTYGPVIPNLYFAFRKQDRFNLFPLGVSKEPLDAQCESIVRQVYEIYGGLHPMRLSELTHGTDTPWHFVRQAKGTLIPDGLIRQHYQKILREGATESEEER